MKMNTVIKKLDGKMPPMKIRNLYFRLTSVLRRRLVKHNDFTIISNNCWGGLVYKSYGLQYLSPTVGLFFMADDYIKFISNLEKYLSLDVFESVSIDESRHKEFLKRVHYHGVIGRLDDIEIMFMHYKNINEAVTKWNRRKMRINPGKVIFKFSEQNECGEGHIKRFIELGYPNKVCFISGKHKNIKDDCVHYIGENGEVTINKEPFGASRILNINSFINNITKRKK